MERPVLAPVVRDAAARGVPVDDLRALLAKAGWPADVVNQHLAKAYQGRQESQPFLSARGISKGFGSHLVLDRVDLDILPGEIFGIIGQSGVGKTLLLSILVGFLEPDSGDVTVRTPAGMVSVFRDPGSLKRLFGFAAQVPSLYENLTARENMEYVAALYGIPPERRKTDSLLRMFRLDEARNELARNLSGGMRKRLDIACAMVHNPRVLILDEPTADLDPLIAQEIWDLIEQINAKGTTILLASHFVQDVERVCTRIGILRNRRMVDVGSPDALRVLYTPYYEVVVETRRAQYDALMRSLRGRSDVGVERLVKQGRSLVVITADPERTLQFVLRVLDGADDVLVRLSVQRPSVQETFETLVRS